MTQRAKFETIDMLSDNGLIWKSGECMRNQIKKLCLNAAKHQKGITDGKAPNGLSVKGWARQEPGSYPTGCTVNGQGSVLAPDRSESDGDVEKLEGRIHHGE